jgi:hypothetical protein
LSSGTAEDKQKAIQKFLSKFLPLSVASDTVIPIEQVTAIANDVKGFLDRTTSVILAKNASETDADLIEAEESEAKLNAKKEYLNFNAFIDDMDGYLTRFSELVYNSTDFVRNPSVRDARGNKFYKFHESTWGDDIINLLINMKPNDYFMGTKGSSIYQAVPEYLKTDFYQRNIFVTGLNYLAAKGEHEASKNVDNSSVTPLLRENLFFFYHREFVQGFLDGMRQYGDEYFMYSYPPSDKPKHPLARVKVLSESEIREGINQALLQILDKQDTTSDVAAYNKSVNNDLFRNFKLGLEALNSLKYSKLTAENLSQVASKVEELMNAKAAEVTKELLSEEVQLTFDIRTYDILNNNLSPKLDKDVNGKSITFDSGKFKNKDYRSGKGEYVVSFSDVYPAFKLFYKNHYINNYFYNQLITGDYAYYADAAGIVKRYAGVLAPGIKPLIDPVIGMSENFRMAVLDDTNILKADTESVLKSLLFKDEKLSEKEQAEFNRLMSFFGKDYDRSDAQGFILPSRANELSRGYGRA